MANLPNLPRQGRVLTLLSEKPSIRLPPELIKAVDALATQEQRTRSAMIRVLLGEALKSRGKETAMARRAAPVIGDEPNKDQTQEPEKK